MVITRRLVLILVTTINIIMLVSAVIIADVLPYGGHEIVRAESAIIIAKAALIQRYGEDEIHRMDFDAFKYVDTPDYWYVYEAILRWGEGPHVLVRRADGKVILRWDRRLYQ